VKAHFNQAQGSRLKVQGSGFKVQGSETVKQKFQLGYQITSSEERVKARVNKAAPQGPARHKQGNKVSS